MRKLSPWDNVFDKEVYQMGRKHQVYTIQGVSALDYFDPMVIFEVQADAAFPIADLFGNFDIVYTSAGSTTTGISGAELDVTTGATTAGLPIKAIDVSRDPNNSDVGSDATNVRVIIQNHIFGQKGAGLA